VVGPTQHKVHKTSPELLACQEINKEVDGRVESWQDSIGEDHEDHTPHWGATFIILLFIIELINIESNPGHVAEDEDGHDEEQDGGVGGLFATAFTGVDGYEDPNIEEDEEKHGNEAEDEESCPVLIVDNIVMVLSQWFQGYPRVVLLIISYLTFKKFRSIYENCQPQHR